MLGYPGFSGFEMMENLEFLILFLKKITIDFQDETLLKIIPTDFLRMSVNVSVGNISYRVKLLIFNYTIYGT